MARSVLLLVLGLCSAVWAEGPHLLRLEPPGMDVSATLKVIADEKLPLGGIIIDVCRSGQTLFPVPDSPYITRQGFEDGTQLTKWIDEIHAQGLKAFAGVDLFRWWLTFSEDPDPFLRVPELQEKGSGYSCTPGPEAHFASPWHPNVRAGLLSLMRKLATRYPGLDGVYLNPLLSLVDYVGFSDAARVAYLRAARIDPIDLPVFGVDDAKEPLLAAWFDWRIAEMTKRVTELVAAYREASAPSTKRVVLAGCMSFPAEARRAKAATAADWVALALSGAGDDLALRPNLGGNQWQECSRGGRAVLDRSRIAGTGYAYVGGEVRGALAPLSEVWQQTGAADTQGMPLLVAPCTGAQLEETARLLGALR